MEGRSKGNVMETNRCQAFAPSMAAASYNIQLRRDIEQAGQDDDLGNTAVMLPSLGRAIGAQGEHGRARALFEESVRLIQALGDGWDIAHWPEEVAQAIQAQGASPHGLRRAAAFVGSAPKRRPEIGVPRPSIHFSDYDRTVAAVRAALNHDLFASAWAEGEAMSVQQAIDVALAGIDLQSR
jgi:hypothetical protein